MRIGVVIHKRRFVYTTPVFLIVGAVVAVYRFITVTCKRHGGVPLGIVRPALAYFYAVNVLLCGIRGGKVQVLIAVCILERMRVYHGHYVLQFRFGFVVAISVKIFVRYKRRIQTYFALVYVKAVSSAYVGILHKRSAGIVGNGYAQRIFVSARALAYFYGIEF